MVFCAAQRNLKKIGVFEFSNIDISAYQEQPHRGDQQDLEEYQTQYHSKKKMLQWQTFY